MSGKLIDFPPIKLASLSDIAAMKVVAVVQRAKQRDFIDLYYLMEKLTLVKILKSVYLKYPWYEENNQIIFTALTFFEDADNDQEIDRITVFDNTLKWENVKRKIRQEVSKIPALTPPASPP